MADWTSTGEAYAASFADLCAGTVDAVLDEAEARAGDTSRRLLDVGTGSGTVAGAAVDRGWTVVGVDAEPSMLEAARRRHPSVRFRAGTLPALDEADGSADAVTTNFVLNHVPDARVAIAELGRVASSRGVVIGTIWLGVTSPLRPLWDAVLDGAGLQRPPERTLPPEVDFDRDAAGVKGLFERAGLVEVHSRVVSWEFAVSPDQLWAGVEGGVATVGGIYREQDAASRARMRLAYDQVTGAAADSRDGMLRVAHSAVLASGKPS